MEEKLKALMIARKKFYEMAHFKVKVKNLQPVQIVANIITKINNE